MTIDECIKYFGSMQRAIAKIGLSRSAAYHWIESGRIPLAQQFKFAKVSNGQLKADEIVIKNDRKGRGTPIAFEDAAFKLDDFMQGLTNLSKKYGIIIKEGSFMHWIDTGKKRSKYAYDYVNYARENKMKKLRAKELGEIGAFELNEDE